MSDIKRMHTRIDRLTELITTSSGINYFPHLLEKEFQANYLKTHLKASRLALLFGFFIFWFGAFFIYLFFPNWILPASVNFFMASPFLVILLILSYTRLFIKFQQVMILIFALIILTALATIAALAPMDKKDLVYQGMILACLFLTTLANLQFRYMIVILIAVMILSNISFYFSGFLRLHYYYNFWAGNYLLLSGTSLCLVTSYFYEVYNRKQFLLKKLVILKNHVLEYVGNYDGLTDVPNRRYFNEMLFKEWQRARREQQCIGLIFLDFDYFKQYNDLYGHSMGDNALKLIAQAIVPCARRPGDFIARYGGDEFIILLANTSLEGTKVVAENTHLAVKNLGIQHADSKVSNLVTITMGVAALMPTIETSPDLLLKKADVALNNGKKMARNHTYVLTDKGVSVMPDRSGEQPSPEEKY